MASSESADLAVDRIGELITNHGNNETKFSLAICDPTKVWLISCAGKLWAAQNLSAGYYHLPCDGLAVTNTIDKSSDNLGDALKTLGCWNGEVSFIFFLNIKIQHH